MISLNTISINADELENIQVDDIENNISEIHIDNSEISSNTIGIDVNIENNYFDSIKLVVLKDDTDIIEFNSVSFCENVYKFKETLDYGLYRITAVVVQIGEAEYQVNLENKEDYYFAINQNEEFDEVISENASYYYDGYTAYPQDTQGSIHSVSEAISWLQNAANNARSFDFDGNGVSCVDLLLEYAWTVGTKFPSLYASEYANSSNIPSGWTFYSYGAAQPGDILVYSGHVAVLGEESTITYHINYAGSLYVRRITNLAYDSQFWAYYGNPYLGCIRYNGFANGSSTSVTGTQSVSDGTYHIVSLLDDNFGLDVFGDSLSNGENIQLYNNINECGIQTFDVTYVGDGYYAIMNENSGLALTADGSDVGSNVKQSTYTGADNQLWIINPTGDNDSFTIIGKESQCLLDVSDGVARNGKNILVWSNLGGTNQKWMFYACGADDGQTIDDGTYFITSQLDSSKGLNIAYETYDDGQNIQLYSLDNNLAQSFIVTYLGNGYYNIINSKTRKSIYPTNASSYVGANVEQRTLTDDMECRWIIRESGGYYKIINAKSGLVLDIYGCSSANEANIDLYTDNNGGNQKWSFQQVGPESITLNKSSMVLETGETSSLSYTLGPSYMLSDVIFSSSDSRTVDVFEDGSVVAYKKGTATITATTANGRTATCEVTVDDKIAHLEGYSLSLNGDIGVNFYMTLSNDVLSDQNAYMEFKVGNQESETQSVSSARTEVVDDKDYYIFTANVGAKDLCTTVTAKLHDSTGVIAEYTYTVNDYIQAIFNRYSPNTKEYAIAYQMMSYGYCTQTYFNYNSNNKPSAPTYIEQNDFSRYVYGLEDENDEISFVGSRLVLTSKPGLKLYFVGDGDFTVDDSEVQITTEGKYSVITIEDIDDFYHMYVIESEDFYLEYGVASYARAAMNGNDTNLKNLVNSMANYYRLFLN